jgi:hypothetical protein
MLLLLFSQAAFDDARQYKTASASVAGGRPVVQSPDRGKPPPPTVARIKAGLLLYLQILTSLGAGRVCSRVTFDEHLPSRGRNHVLDKVTILLRS